MPQSATNALRFALLGSFLLSVDFQDGRLTIEGVWPLVAEADAVLALSLPKAGHAGDLPIQDHHVGQHISRGIDVNAPESQWNRQAVM